MKDYVVGSLVFAYFVIVLSDISMQVFSDDIWFLCCQLNFVCFYLCDGSYKLLKHILSGMLGKNFEPCMIHCIMMSWSLVVHCIEKNVESGNEALLTCHKFLTVSALCGASFGCVNWNRSNWSISKTLLSWFVSCPPSQRIFPSMSAVFARNGVNV